MEPRVPDPESPVSRPESRIPNPESRLPPLTPFSTVGPFFRLLVRHRTEDTDTLVTEATHGRRISIEGRLLDGNGAPIDDGLIEIWQADADGRYRHPEDPHRESADAAFGGFGRVATGPPGQFTFHTVKPGAVAGPGGRLQAPHILLGVMARGIMSRCWTRIYFDDEPANADDAVLQLVPEHRRATLIARSIGEGLYRVDIVVQGEGETVFFEA
jgi:protocatechuate 3,4-dioxygenase alpha subunit